MKKRWFLLTYHHAHQDPRAKSADGFHYDIVRDVEAWIESVQQYEDGDYVLINVLPVSDEFVKNVDGELKTM